MTTLSVLYIFIRSSGPLDLITSNHFAQTLSKNPLYSTKTVLVHFTFFQAQDLSVNLISLAVSLTSSLRNQQLITFAAQMCVFRCWTAESDRRLDCTVTNWPCCKACWEPADQLGLASSSDSLRLPSESMHSAVFWCGRTICQLVLARTVSGCQIRLRFSGIGPN